MSEEQIADVTRLFGNFTEAQLATMFNAEDKEVGRAVIVAGKKAPQALEGGNASYS